MSHHHTHEVSGKNLLITIFLNVFITLSQFVGGVMSGSLALLSDAVHNLSDVLALVIAYGANRLSLRPSSATKTFGYKRAEVLATLFNASILVVIAIFLMIEAVQKFYNPEVVNSVWVIALGVMSIVLNAVSVLLIKDDSHHNMNMKAAYLHLLTDVMTSVAVVVGGLLMYCFQLFWVDPLISILIAIYLVKASSSLIRDASVILMQFTPLEVDVDKVIRQIVKEQEIKNVHDLHLWSLDDHHIYLDGHLEFVENLTIQDSNLVIEKLEALLYREFKITNVTFKSIYNK